MVKKIGVPALTVFIILIVSMTTLVACDNKRTLSEGELLEVIYNADFLCIDNPVGFISPGELSIGDIFNLYASGKVIQEKMAQLADGKESVEIPLRDFEKFVKKYFNDYEFTPGELAEELSGRLDFDKEIEMIHLYGTNGGVRWPASIESDIVIDSIENDGDLTIVNATRHYYDGIGTDDYHKIVLKIKITKDAYNYIAFQARKL